MYRQMDKEEAGVRRKVQLREKGSLEQTRDRLRRGAVVNCALVRHQIVPDQGGEVQQTWARSHARRPSWGQSCCDIWMEAFEAMGACVEVDLVR